MKNFIYIFYSVLFYVYSIFPIKSNKTTFIAKHDKSLNGNIMCMYNKVKKENAHYICKFIKNINLNEKDKLQLIRDIMEFIFLTPYHLATSEVIFLDSVFLPMAYMKFRKKVRVVQLWHGCNTLKKFGQLSNKGRLKVLEKRANSRYTDVIVSSKKMIELHKEAFGVSEKIIYPLGLPRMDIFFDEVRMKEEKQRFYTQFDELKEKKIILYAPTFRDNNINSFDDNMNLKKVAENLPENYVIINKFHPFVAKRYGKIEGKNMRDLSGYDDLTRLLLVADILISDYSSIIFDYAILKKPIIFYAYDKEEYEDKIRGFYYNYEDYIGEKIIKTKNELIKKIINIKYDNNNNNNFVERYVDFKNFNSVDKIYKKVYKVL